MSEENNLGEEAKENLSDAAESAKEQASNAADNVKEKASELADDAKEAFNEAKEKASDFAEDVKEETSEFVKEAKESVNEFTEDANEALSDGKTIGIISHLTLIGWIIAFVKNNNEKTEIGSFYLRQTLGLFIMMFIASFLAIIPIIGWLIWLGVVVLWVISLVGALGGKMKPLPLLGDKFQEWFKTVA